MFQAPYPNISSKNMFSRTCQISHGPRPGILHQRTIFPSGACCTSFQTIWHQIMLGMCFNWHTAHICIHSWVCINSWCFSFTWLIHYGSTAGEGHYPYASVQQEHMAYSDHSPVKTGKLWFMVYQSSPSYKPKRMLLTVAIMCRRLESKKNSKKKNINSPQQQSTATVNSQQQYSCCSNAGRQEGQRQSASTPWKKGDFWLHCKTLLLP